MARPREAKSSYGQYCPLALATELLCRRWTVLVVSRLIDGCTTFSEIHRGVPRISPSLLSTRLSELEHAGLVTRVVRADSGKHDYELTKAGWDLEDIVMSLSVWGQNWARDMERDDLDPGFLAWSMHTRLDVKAMPPGRTVLQFSFSGAPADCRRFWLVAESGKVDMCLKDPGFETDLLVEANLRQFVETWRGFRDLRTEIRAARIKLTGPPAMKKSLPDWLMMSALASVGRKREGGEKKLASRKSGRQV
jgi:DNA-binding HxlR family transcriptional regulator